MNALVVRVLDDSRCITCSTHPLCVQARLDMLSSIKKFIEDLSEQTKTPTSQLKFILDAWEQASVQSKPSTRAHLLLMRIGRCYSVIHVGRIWQVHSHLQICLFTHCDKKGPQLHTALVNAVCLAHQRWRNNSCLVCGCC